MSNTDIALLLTGILIVTGLLLWAAIYLIDNYMLAADDRLLCATAFISTWITEPA